MGQLNTIVLKKGEASGRDLTRVGVGPSVAAGQGHQQTQQVPWTPASAMRPQIWAGSSACPGSLKKKKMGRGPRRGTSHFRTSMPRGWNCLRHLLRARCARLAHDGGRQPTGRAPHQWRVEEGGSRITARALAMPTRLLYDYGPPIVCTGLGGSAPCASRALGCCARSCMRALSRWKFGTWPRSGLGSHMPRACLGMRTALRCAATGGHHQGSGREIAGQRELSCATVELSWGASPLPSIWATEQKEGGSSWKSRATAADTD